MAQTTYDAQPLGDASALHHADTNDRLLAWLGMLSRYVALFAAWTATSGSLFFSEVLGWLPCVLCWYQRILMYPLAAIIAIGIVRRDPKLHWYALPLSLLGACVSLYHYLLVKTDWLPPPPCVAGIPCTVEYLNWFGFINIPFLALTAFLVISFTLVAATLGPWGAAAADLSLEEPVRPGGIMADVAVVGVIAAVVGSFLVAARFV